MRKIFILLIGIYISLMAETLEKNRIFCDSGQPMSCFDKPGLNYIDDNKSASEHRKECNSGKVRHCINLGYMYINGKGIKQDLLKAKGLFEEVCSNTTDRFAGGGCSNLGYMYSSGLGITQDYEKAVNFYTKACNGGIAMGCNNLGYMYLEAKGVEEDILKAKELFKKACDGGYIGGCKNYELLNKWINKLSINEVQKNCDKGDTFMCLILGYAYYDGTKVKQNYKKAKEYYKKACNGNNESGCENFILLKELERENARTEAVNKMNKIPNEMINDEIKRKGSIESAQDFVAGMNRRLKREGGSHKVDEMTIQQYSILKDKTIILNFTIDKTAFKKYYQKEYSNMNEAIEANMFLLREMNTKRFCSVNFMRSMMKNGITFSFLYKFNDGTPLPSKELNYNDCKTTDNYKKHFKMCREDRAYMCYTIGSFYESGLVIKSDYNKSIFFYKKGCDYGYIGACSNLGGIYLIGTDTVSKDYTLAHNLLKKSCTGGSSQSCSLLGFMYYEGKGVPKDMNKAKEFLKQACDLGDAEGCQIYKKIKL